jgi:hypothetical protein
LFTSKVQISSILFSSFYKSKAAKEFALNIFMYILFRAVVLFCPYKFAMQLMLVSYILIHHLFCN